MRRWLGEQAAEGRVDVFHSHALWVMPCVYPARVARASGVPLVVSPRGSLAPAAMRFSAFRKAVFWRLEQGPALHAAQLLHATAESELADIRAAGFRQPVAVIPNGVDIPPARSPELRKGPRVLLYLGRIHPIKGLDSLLRAWQAVASRHRDWELRIVGPGEPAHVAEVRRLAQELRVERVRFAEPTYGPQRLAAYRSAELYVLPTRSENFGMTVAEALAAGTPAIVTRGAPWPGLNEHDAGWWIEHGVEALVATLDVALACDQTRLAGMGENGRRWVADSLGWARIGGMMQSTYLWILGRGSRPEYVHV
jgi:glycosyltransferase involved in cell wall biosynthesis